MMRFAYNGRTRTVLKRLAIVLPLVVILAYVLIASYKLRIPGTQYDEALYVNAALGGIDATTFITKSFHGIPILLMPYIGALKSYIFFPIFALFGVSPITMRLPVIFLTAAGLYIFYRLLQAEVGRFLGLLILAVTALDASFIMFTRLDNGPVVLDFLLKIIGLALLLRFAQSHRLRLLVLFWVVMLLGVFNKLNFIWYVNAFLAAYLLVYGRRLWHELQRTARLKVIGVLLIGYVTTAFYYLYISAHYHLKSSFGFVGWQLIYKTLSGLVDGSWFYNYALSSQRIGTTIIFWLLIAIAILGLLSLVILHRRKLAVRFTRLYFFCSLILLFIVTQLAVTKQATAGWHYFSVYPFVGTLFVLSLAALGQIILPMRLKIAYLFNLLVVAVFCIYQLVTYHTYTLAYNRTPANLTWSPAIYGLTDFAKAHHSSTFVSLDWGSQTQLLAFDPVPAKYAEVFGPVLVNVPAENARDFQLYIASKPGAYYITHDQVAEIFPEVKQDFFRLAEMHGYKVVHVATIKDNATPVFELYQMRHQL